MILDLFAGAGGWEEGARTIGHHGPVVGIEHDTAACRTAVAAGHPRIRADVTTYPTGPFVGRTAGLIASPPCQAWSMAGNRKGEADRTNCHALADRMAAGDDDTTWTAWEDERSPLVCQPVRWVRDLHPEWVALEQVPPVASLWEHFARILRGWGYSVWTGDLLAADYGVPQTRLRRILMASRVRTVTPPEPTHAEHPTGTDLFGGDGRALWVSMADALSWSDADTVKYPRGQGITERHGDREPWTSTEPAPTVTTKARCWLRMGNQANSAVRHITEPAPTVLFGHRANAVDWWHTRPATTVVGSYCPDVISAPGYRTSVSQQNAEGGVRVTVAEAGILQSFRPDYPWQGSRTRQFLQVGNACPPKLAAHVLAALGVGHTPTLNTQVAP